MRVKKTMLMPTKAKVYVVADDKELLSIKDNVINSYQGKVRVAGFRTGKVPLEILEKKIDQTTLQADFLQVAVEQLYITAMDNEKLRQVDNPNISIKKFVPYTLLEFEAEVEVIGDIKLPNYKKIMISRPEIKVEQKEVDLVIETLRDRLAEKNDVQRAARVGDQIYIDFTGSDTKTNKPVTGAQGRNYPIILGSNTFVPGFEDKLIGMKAGDKKIFTIRFPKTYQVSTLRNRRVEFDVTVIKVQSVKRAKLDDSFAAKAGPVKTVAALKRDIEQQLKKEKSIQAERDFESQLVREISNKTEVSIPDTLIKDQIERLWSDVKQNLLYRGQTIKEFLESEGKTELQYIEDVLKPQAQERVKGGLVLSEIARIENLVVDPKELKTRMQWLMEQYKQDNQMLIELGKPEAKQEIASRILTEKTLERLKSYN